MSSPRPRGPYHSKGRRPRIPSSHASSLRELRRALARHDLSTLRVFVPWELVPGLPHPVPYAESFADRAALEFDLAVVQLDKLNMIDGHALARICALHCHFADDRFLLFARAPTRYRPPDPGPLAGLRRRARAAARGLATDGRGYAIPRRRRHAGVRRAVLVTTFNRPAALQRSLPQIAALGLPVVVVDDGSEATARDANFHSCRDAGATYVGLAENRGLAAAMNVGLGYVLADPAVEWISYFQDDVDVAAETMERLARLEHPDARPLLTGYDADEHPTVDTRDIAGISVALKPSTPAVHMHAHVAFWKAVMPIPSEYLGAPKPGRGASGEDWWISAAAARRGLLIPCVPGLVRTFVWHPSDSTWGMANLPDPPLRSR